MRKDAAGDRGTVLGRLRSEPPILKTIDNSCRALPQDKQKEVLDHAEHLRGQEAHSRAPRKPGRGLWADLKVDLSAGEIDEDRQEMWKDFPRDDI
jgi:hypothetical protein